MRPPGSSRSPRESSQAMHSITSTVLHRQMAAGVPQYAGSATKHLMTSDPAKSQAAHTRLTKDAYDRLAAVWASTTDDDRSTDSLSVLPFAHLSLNRLRGRSCSTRVADQVHSANGC